MTDRKNKVEEQKYAADTVMQHNQADVLSSVFEQDSRRYVMLLNEEEQVRFR